MYVLGPFTSLRAEVVHALTHGGFPYDIINVAESDHAYYDLLAEAWGRGESFVVCEHDILPHDGAFHELAECPHDWCGFSYHYGPSIISGLGCVKFSAALIARNPDAMERVGEMSDAKHPPKHWCRLDAWLNGCVLAQREGLRHEHEPMVTHLGSGCSHGCL